VSNLQDLLNSIPWETHRAIRSHIEALQVQNARQKEALGRLIGHAECMQARYKASEDRTQAAEDIHFAKQVLLQFTSCPINAPHAERGPERG
jgi:hypothetical protein